MTQFYEHPDWQNASCVDPASTGSAVLYEGLFEFKDLKNTASGLCVDAEGYDSRVGTALQSYGCHGGRNQGFYFDQSRGSLHVELSHDRCVDAADGTGLTLQDCDGASSQKFTVDDAGIHPKGDSGRCLAFDGGGTEAALVLGECGTDASSFAMTTRDYENPDGSFLN